MHSHPWKLVGPWYRSRSVGGADGRHRDAAPILQKYAAGDFANRLVREPQESLKFTGEDFVNRITIDPDQVVTDTMHARDAQPFKLFLDLHSRFYTVLAELHCDVAGFPDVDRGQVCEAGFVVRRRRPSMPASAEAAFARNRAEYRRLRGRLLKSGAASVAPQSPGSRPPPRVETLAQLLEGGADARGGRLRRGRVARLQAALEANAAGYAALHERHGIHYRVEGWFPSDQKGIGEWRDVEKTPAALEEAVLPMYPLIADPTDAGHSARGRAQWFGVVPSGSSDTAADGSPRYEDGVLYELRCFVRRHETRCPKRTNGRDCSGEIVWSTATESYQLASAFDLDGGSHRPVSIKLPDFAAMRDQAELGPPGRGVNVRAITPPGGGMNFQSDGMEMPEKGSTGGGSGEFCFYFSFVFFIVAYFLFQLFLPIVMFVLQLWFLLKLKLCLPPSISIDAGLAVDLKLEGELGVQLDAGVGAGAGIEFGGPPGPYTTSAGLKAAIAEKIADGLDISPGLAQDFGARLGTDPAMNVDDVGALFVDLATDFAETPATPELAGELPTPERGLVYFEKVVNP